MYIINTTIDGTLTMAGTWNGDTPPPGAIITDRLANSKTDYYLNGILRKKVVSTGITSKSTINADGLDTVVISGLCNPSQLRINNKSVGTVVDTEVELTFDTAGEYDIKIESVPYLDYEVTINAI